MPNTREKEKLIELLNEAGEKLKELCGGLNDNNGNGVRADHLIANGVTVQEWFPVTERLPKKDGIYLTFNKKKEYEFHFFQTGKRMWQAIWEEDGVTHWMPLPQPPKGE